MQTIKTARNKDWIYVKIDLSEYPGGDTFRVAPDADIRAEVYRRYGEYLPYKVL